MCSAERTLRRRLGFAAFDAARGRHREARRAPRLARASTSSRTRRATVVYVGKAKSLRSRVRSYFQEGTSDNRYFIPILQRTIGDLDTIVTATEKEAAILENNLIKEHQPRYNVKLRDDKDYISPPPRHEGGLAAPLGRAPAHRRPAGRLRYFGPYHSATAARRTLHLVNKHFQLRTCTDAELRSRKRPCLQHQIKRCPAPCVLEVDEAWYDEQVRAVAMFLDGRHDELSQELEERMQDAARDMQFELAAMYRDQLSRDRQGARGAARRGDRRRRSGRARPPPRGRSRRARAPPRPARQARRRRDLLAQERRAARRGGGRRVPRAALRPSLPRSARARRDVRGRGRRRHAAHPRRDHRPVLPEAAAGIAEWLARARAPQGERCSSRSAGSASICSRSRTRTRRTRSARSGARATT